MKKIGYVSVCGIRFEVFQSNPDQDTALEDCYGYTKALQCRIVLREDLNPTCFRNTLIHEIQHAVWEHSGIKDLLAVQMGASRDDLNGIEEVFIQVFTPHLIEALASMKNIKLK